MNQGNGKQEDTIDPPDEKSCPRVFATAAGNRPMMTAPIMSSVTVASKRCAPLTVVLSNRVASRATAIAERVRRLRQFIVSLRTSELLIARRHDLDALPPASFHASPVDPLRGNVVLDRRLFDTGPAVALERGHITTWSFPEIDSAAGEHEHKHERRKPPPKSLADCHFFFACAFRSS